MAQRPKRTPSGLTVNASSLELMSGRQDRHAEIAALAQIHGELVGVGSLDRQQGRHEVPRIGGLEIRRLIGDPGVGRRMRLRKAVAGEVLHQLEDFSGLLLVDPLRARARHERFALLRHDLGILLPHGLPKHIGLPEREAGERLRDAHHLFLIRDDAVGIERIGSSSGSSYFTSVRPCLRATKSSTIPLFSGPGR